MLRDADGRQIRWRWWRTIGVLGVALALPGGLVFLLYLIARARTRTDSILEDPYVAWLRMRDQIRTQWRPGAGPGATSTSHAPNGRQASFPRPIPGSAQGNAFSVSDDTPRPRSADL
jgi:hypothetical protein